MKITKIKALCKEGKAVQILGTDNTRQWIGTKDAIYPADGLTITRESLPSLFDMPDVCKVLEVTDGDLCASDLNPVVRFEEWPQMGSGMPVVYLGKSLIPLGEGGGFTSSGRIWSRRRRARRDISSSARRRTRRASR